MNTKSYSRIIALSIMTFLSQPALSGVIQISNSNIPDIVKNKGINYKEIQNKALTNDLLFEQLSLGYNWNMGFDISKELDKTDSTTTALPPDSEKDKYSLLLNKKFTTSTAATFELTRINYKANSTNAVYSQNYFAATLDQNLFPFLSTPQDALNFNSLKSDSVRTKLQAEIDLNDNIKDALSLYWKTLSIQKSVQENTDLLKKYEALVKKIQRKRTNSNSTAGELEQALAEYELRKQTLIEDSNSLDNYILQLKQILNINTQDKIELVQTQNNNFTLPEKFNRDVKILKRYQIQKLKVESAINNYDAVKEKGLPRIGLYGRFTQQGLDSNTNQSVNELTNDGKDKYAVGLKLDYYFDDTASVKEKEIKLATREIETERLNRLDTDLQNQITITRQKLDNAFASLKTSNAVLKYRNEALKQINMNYVQGRTDISFLIDAFNKKIQAEIAIINTLGNFETTLAEYNNLVIY